MTGLLGSVEVGALPSPVVAFLTQLGVALHKTRAYPPGHPMRDQAIGLLQQAIRDALGAEPSLRVLVARRQLVVGGVGSDPDHFVLRDLAAKLSRLQVGALIFRRGIQPDDLTELVEHLATESASTGVAQTIRTPWAREAVEVVPMSFDALALQAGREDRGDSEEAADQLWRDLANRILAGGSIGDAVPGSAEADQAANGGGDGPEPPLEPVEALDLEVARILLSGPTALAEALADRLQRPELQVRLRSTLERMARAAPELEAGERKVVEVRLRHLLASLGPEALQTLLDLDLSRRDDLSRLAAAAEWLPVSAVLDLVESAASVQEPGLSRHLLRLLRKLERNADLEAEVAAGRDDLRSTVRALLENWSLGSPNPWHHTRVLEIITAAERAEGDSGEAGDNEGLRLVLMALETGVVGPLVLEGVEIAIESGDLAPMIHALETAPDGSEVAASIWEALVEPAALRRHVTVARVPPAQLKQLLERVGTGHAELLLELLGATADLQLQRVLLERVVEFGSPAAGHLNRRIADLPADGLRNVLRLLAEMPELPDGFAPTAHTLAADPMVRLEAYRVLLRLPAERVEALHAAFSDADERVVRVAVDAALEGLPASSLGRLMLLLGSPARSVALRARAVPILRQFRSASVLRWLTERLTVRRGLFRRPRLIPKTPIVVARVRVLAEAWSHTPQAQRVLRLALASGDRDLIAAAKAAPEPSE